MTKIVPGKTTFRYIHADSNALWRVVSPRGADTWNCEIAPSDVDYAGTKKVFGSEEIKRAIAQSEIWAEMAKSNKDFWTTRKVGEVLHYENRHGQWVRGTVVDGLDKENKPARVLRVEALVGRWDRHDLPTWYDTGRYNEGYHVKQIRDGATIQPHEGGIFEWKFMSGQPTGIDPRGLEPIDLTPPVPTEKQREAAHLLKQVETIRDILSHLSPEGMDYPEMYRDRLQKVAELVNELELNGPEPTGPKY